MPNEELKGIEDRIEDFMPAAEKIVRGEGENVARRLENAWQIGQEQGRIECVIPRGDVVVQFPTPRRSDVPRRVGAQVIGRIGQQEIDGGIGQGAEKIEGISDCEMG